MKTQLLLGGAILAAISLTACDESSRLAGEVEGTWTSPMTEMVRKTHDKEHKDRHADKRVHEMPPAMSCAPTITFSRTQGTNGGDITIAGDFELTQPVTIVDTVAAAPVAATVSGRLNAGGTWLADDDDEIKVTLDPSRTEIAVDPASLTLSYATLTDSDPAALESIKARVAGNITEAVIPMVRRHVARLHKLDDIKTDGTTMRMEIGKTKLTLTRK